MKRTPVTLVALLFAACAREVGPGDDGVDGAHDGAADGARDVSTIAPYEGGCIALHDAAAPDAQIPAGIPELCVRALRTNRFIGCDAPGCSQVNWLSLELTECAEQMSVPTCHDAAVAYWSCRATAPVELMCQSTGPDSCEQTRSCCNELFGAVFSCSNRCAQPFACNGAQCACGNVSPPSPGGTPCCNPANPNGCPPEQYCTVVCSSCH